MSNTNSTNLKGCYSCSSCSSCYYCDSCSSCSSCSSCYSCSYCSSCSSCDSCYSCSYCDSCDSCSYCDSCDSCSYSKGLRLSERMLFCLGEGGLKSKGAGYQKNNQIFNTQVTPDELDEAKASLPVIKIDVTKWVEKDSMTDDEKSKASGWETMGGYLKRYGYEEAWAKWWGEASKKDKDAILNLPHFNKDIFKGITGIDVESNPKEIVIDGATYVLKTNEG